MWDVREREESNILSQTGLNKQTNKQASNKNHRYTSAVECLPSLSKAMGLILSIAGIKGNDLNMLFTYFSWEPYLGSSQMVPLSYTQNPSFC